MIPHLHRMAVTERQWLAEEDFRLGVAVSQAIPGATVMQLAAYIGLRLRGLAGALAAFVGFCLPAFLLITGLSALYFRFRELPGVLSSFLGLKAVVVAIIASAAVDFARTHVKGAADAALAAAACAAFLFQVSPVAILLGAMLAGAALGRDGAKAGALPGGARTCAGPHWSGLLRLVLGLGGLTLLLWTFDARLGKLVLLMMRVDVFAFGGGFSALPLMLHEVVVRQGWLSEQVFMDGIALGQVTPGPIVITAAFVGLSLAGILGAAAGTLGVFSPSFLMLVGTVPLCDRFLHRPMFRRMLRASLATLGGLMASMAWTMARPLPWTAATILIGVGAFAALRRRIDILWVVLAGAGVSLAVL